MHRVTRCEDCRRRLEASATTSHRGRHINQALTDGEHLDIWTTGRPHKPPPTYEYTDLPKRRGCIRLLNLFSSSPINPQIECELITIEFKDNDSKNESHPDTKYEALSWCWGATKHNSYINIRKGKKLFAKYVSPDLLSALRVLRHDQVNRYLWIDAVCIDQENFLERNHQVEMMSDIYGKAEQVCIWLGDGDKSSSIALNFIKKEVLQLQNFDELCDSEEASSKWGALLDLMQRPWFSRRWVVQEIALARKATLYCGADRISWRKFAVAVELFVEVETATHRLSEVMKKDPRFYHVPGWFEYVSALGASLLVDATGKLFRDYKVNAARADLGHDTGPNSEINLDSESDSDSDSGSELMFDGESKSRKRSTAVQATRGLPLLSLEYLVSSLSIFEASVPHDTIYALLAIARDTTPSAINEDAGLLFNHTQHMLERFTQKKRYRVEYERPYVDVCKDFVDFCIERSRHSDKTRALDVICRPWAPEEKKNAPKPNLPGWQKSQDDPVPLPSWIPQLSGASYAMYPHAGIHTLKMDRKNADTLVGLPSLTQRNYNAAETKGIDMKVLKFRKRPSMKHYSMYVKGFVLDTVEKVENSSQGGSIPEEWATAGGWPKAPKSAPPDEFWRTLVADRGRDGKNPPVYYARACKESFMKGGLIGGSVNTTDLINNERCSVVAQFCRRVQAVIWNRSLIKTKTKKLGLVGKNVRPGDLVCILYGCSVPVILRKSDPKSREEIEMEIEEELRHLKTETFSGWKKITKRTKVFQGKRGRERWKYRQWEGKMVKKWQEDEGWRELWKQKREPWQEDRKWRKHWLQSLEKGKRPQKSEQELEREVDKMANMDEQQEQKLLDSREYTAWKREKHETAKREGKEWDQPVDWREFKLLLRYGRRWKEDHLRRKGLLKSQAERTRDAPATDSKSSMPSTDQPELPNASDHPETANDGRDENTSGTENGTQNHSDEVPNPALAEASQGAGASPSATENDARENGTGTKGSPHNGQVSDPPKPVAQQDSERNTAETYNPQATPGMPPASEPSGTTRPNTLEAAAPKGNPKSDAEKYKPNENEYMARINEALGEDDLYYYEFLGECYIHGMMDGEAMAYQNNNEVRSQMFELR
jgi:hypothetical protein